MLKKLDNYLQRHSLVTLYKAFMRLHLDYADIIYDKPNNANIYHKIETGNTQIGKKSSKC